MNELSEREAILVNIGYMQLYCENFKVSAISELSEQPTVSGATLITNKCKKATRIVLKGRIYNKEQPISFATIANTMNSISGYTIQYRGLQFKDCIIYGFTIEDKGDDFVYVSVTLATSESIKIKTEVT